MEIIWQDYLDYMLGQELHHNPYTAYGDEEIDDMSYYQYYDGWVQAQKEYPKHMENFE